MGDDDARKVGHPTGTTVFVERKTRTTYIDGTVTDTAPRWHWDGELAGLQLFGARLGDTPEARTRRKRLGIVSEVDLYRQVTVEAGDWVTRDDVEPATTEADLRRFCAADNLAAGDLVFTRDLEPGEQIIGILGCVPVWPLRQGSETRRPLGVVVDDYRAGEVVLVESVGQVSA